MYCHLLWFIYKINSFGIIYSYLIILLSYPGDKNKPLPLEYIFWMKSWTKSISLCRLYYKLIRLTHERVSSFFYWQNTAVSPCHRLVQSYGGILWIIWHDTSSEKSYRIYLTVWPKSCSFLTAVQICVELIFGLKPNKDVVLMVWTFMLALAFFSV